MAVELPVSDRYAADGLGGANDEGTARKDGEEKKLGEKKNWAAGTVVVCRGMDRAGDKLVSALKTCC